MARKKRRFEQLEAAAATPKEKKIYVNPLQEKVDNRLDEVGQRLEGKGKTILYGLGALAVVLILVFVVLRWSRGTETAAQTALGKAITTATAPISETGTLAGSSVKSYKTERERAEAAIVEFQTVVDKFSGSAADKAKYFIATSRLHVDRAAGIQELEGLAGSDTPAGKLAKFALAQTRVDDNRLDDALKLYQEMIGLEVPLLAKDTINFEIAKIYEKQGKKNEAVEIYFNIASAASEAKDADGKALPLTETATEAKKKLKEIDPARAQQIPEPTPDSTFGGMGGDPFSLQ